MRVIDIGSGAGTSVAFEAQKEEVEIVRVDVDPGCNPDIIHDIRNPFPEEMHGQFDLAYVSHVLEHIERAMVMDVVKNIVALLKENAEIWILVPSLEWAAESIRKEQYNPALQGVLYGSQGNEWQYHKTGFTLPLLRSLVRTSGCIPRKVYQTLFYIDITSKDGTVEQIPTLQNIIIAAKVTEPGGEE